MNELLEKKPTSLNLCNLIKKLPPEKCKELFLELMKSLPDEEMKGQEIVFDVVTNFSPEVAREIFKNLDPPINSRFQNGIYKEKLTPEQCGVIFEFVTNKTAAYYSDTVFSNCCEHLSPLEQLKKCALVVEQKHIENFNMHKGMSLNSFSFWVDHRSDGLEKAHELVQKINEAKDIDQAKGYIAAWKGSTKPDSFVSNLKKRTGKLPKLKEALELPEQKNKATSKKGQN